MEQEQEQPIQNPIENSKVNENIDLNIEQPITIVGRKWDIQVIHARPMRNINDFISIFGPC